MEMVYGLISKGMEEYCDSLWLQPGMVWLSTAGFHCWVRYPRDFSFSILISKMWIIERKNLVLWAVTLSASHLSKFKHSWWEASDVKHKCKGSWVQKIFEDLLQDGWKHECKKLGLLALRSCTTFQNQSNIEGAFIIEVAESDGKICGIDLQWVIKTSWWFGWPIGNIAKSLRVYSSWTSPQFWSYDSIFM